MCIRDRAKVRDMAVIWGGEVRMANLCICACFAVNGVSALHSEILKKDVFHDAYTQNLSLIHISNPFLGPYRNFIGRVGARP